MPNVFAEAFEYDATDPAGYRCGVALVGKQAGARANVVKLYEMPPGESLCPYHYEYEEEWLLLLSGELWLRGAAEERTVVAGELICFPTGPEGGHKLTNRGQDPARVMMFSSAREPAVAVYPDSDKIGVYTPRAEDQFVLRRADGNAPYYAGEV